MLLAALVLFLGVGAVTYRVVVSPDTSPAPATRESLAAVAIDVLGIEPSSYVPDLDLDYGIRVNWHPDHAGSREAHALYLDIGPRKDDADRPCGSDCATWNVDGGEVRLEWQDATFESDPGRFQLTYVTDGELRSLAYSGAEILGDPRESEDLPIPVSGLVEVVTDERFASTTTQEMVSVELEGWPEGWEDDNRRVATTPTVVAHWMQELGVGLMAGTGDAAPPTVTPFSPSVYGEDAVGADVKFDGWSVSAVIVAADSAPTCGRGWHCATAPHFFVDRNWQVTTGWRRGQALVINHLNGREVIAKVTSPSIDSFPTRVREGDPVRVSVGEAVQDFERYIETRWSLTTTQGVLDAYADLEPFES